MSLICVLGFILVSVALADVRCTDGSLETSLGHGDAKYVSFHKSYQGSCPFVACGTVIGLSKPAEWIVCDDYSGCATQSGRSFRIAGNTLGKWGTTHNFNVSLSPSLNGENASVFYMAATGSSVNNEALESCNFPTFAKKEAISNDNIVRSEKEVYLRRSNAVKKLDSVKKTNNLYEEKKLTGKDGNVDFRLGPIKGTNSPNSGSIFYMASKLYQPFHLGWCLFTVGERVLLGNANACIEPSGQPKECKKLSFFDQINEGNVSFGYFVGPKLNETASFYTYTLEYYNLTSVPLLDGFAIAGGVAFGPVDQVRKVCV